PGLRGRHRHGLRPPRRRDRQQLTDALRSAGHGTEPAATARPAEHGASMITVLAGGVGAARFLAGLVQCVDPREITAVCNVGDDFEWHGLHVSPDIDTVIYTLAGIEGELGWGLRDDTHVTLEAL